MSLTGGSVVPFVTPETAPFWQAVSEERLSIQRCNDCGHFYFPPGPICPKCASRNVAWVDVSGDATLYSFMIAPKPWPEWRSDGPMSVAHVELAEGPRLMSTVVDCLQTPDAFEIDMPLKAVFRPFADMKMLCFRPANAARCAT